MVMEAPPETDIPVTDEQTEEASQLQSSPSGEHARWEGIVGFENEMTGDGRVIAANALRWPDDLAENPIPIRYVASDVGAHDGAQVVGYIDQLARLEPLENGSIPIWGSGIIDDEGEVAREAYRHVDKKMTNGVSMDLDDVAFEVLTDPANPETETMQTNDARIRAVTIVAIPAFAGARISIVNNQAAQAQPAASTEAGTTALSTEDNPSVIVSTNSARGMRAHAINKARLRKLAANPRHAAFAYQSTRVKDPNGDWVETPAAAIDIAANTTAPDDPFEQGLAILNEADMIELGSPEYLAKVREAVPFFENVTGDRAGDASKVLEILNSYLSVKWPEPVTDEQAAAAGSAPEGDLDEKKVEIAPEAQAPAAPARAAAASKAFAFNPDQWRNPRNGRWIDMPNKLLNMLDEFFGDGSREASPVNRKALGEAKVSGEEFINNLNSGNVPGALDNIDTIQDRLADIELDHADEDVRPEETLERVNEKLEELKTIDWFSAAQSDDSGIGSFDEPGFDPDMEGEAEWDNDMVEEGDVGLGESDVPAGPSMSGDERDRVGRGGSSDVAGFVPEGTPDQVIESLYNYLDFEEDADEDTVLSPLRQISGQVDEALMHAGDGRDDTAAIALTDAADRLRDLADSGNAPEGSAGALEAAADRLEAEAGVLRGEAVGSDMDPKAPIDGTLDNGRGDDDNTWWFDDEADNADEPLSEDQRDLALARAGAGDLGDLVSEGKADWVQDGPSGDWELIGDDGDLIATVEAGGGTPYVHVNEDVAADYRDMVPSASAEGQQVAGGTIEAPSTPSDIAPSDGDSNYTQKALSAGAEMEEWLKNNAKTSSLDQKQRFEDYRQAMEDINEGMKDGSLTPSVALTALMMADENYGGMGTTDAFVSARRRLEDELMSGVVGDGPSRSDVEKAANLLGLDVDDELKKMDLGYASVLTRWAREIGAPLEQIKDALSVLAVDEKSDVEGWASLTPTAQGFSKMVRAGVDPKDALSVYVRTLTERGAGSMFVSSRKGQKLSVQSFNWVEETGGLPAYIRDIADALMRRGQTESRAIATAVQTVKRWARGGSARKGGKGSVSAKTQAKAAKALAEWEAKRARARATSVEKSKRAELASKSRAQALTASSSLRPGSSAPATAVSTVRGAGVAAKPRGARKFAGVAPIAPPKAWFEMPEPNGPQPITIDDDGRVYGHVATYDQCHIASPSGEGVCIMAPRSRSGYAYFHTGSVRTAEGSTVPTGRLTMNGSHAGPNLSMANAAAHYDNTSLAWADVRAIDGKHGIWVCGALRPEITAAQIRTLRASPVSGDWRRAGGNLEMILALSVNGPGFPVIPRPSGLVASVGGYDLENEDHELISLVAAGMLAPKKVLPKTDPEALSTEDLKYLRALAQREREADKAAKLESVRKTANKLSAAKNRARVEALAQTLRAKAVTASAEKAEEKSTEKGTY